MAAHAKSSEGIREGVALPPKLFSEAPVPNASILCDGPDSTGPPPRGAAGRGVSPPHGLGGLAGAGEAAFEKRFWGVKRSFKTEALLPHLLSRSRKGRGPCSPCRPLR